MCRTLARLLDVPEEKLAISVRHLEQASGQPSNDVRLSAEIVGKVYQATKALGLDPVDTTGPELYHSMLGLIEKHDKFLVKRIGGTEASDVNDLATCIVRIVNRLKIPKQVWVIKHSAIKRLLKQQVPKRAMKQLGYRSLDSLLKREPMGRLVTLLPILESDKWYELFVQRYQQLTPSDFEHRSTEVLALKGSKWQDISEQFRVGGADRLLSNKELGVITLVPGKNQKQLGYVISTLPAMLHLLGELRLHSTYLKLMQIRPNFGQIVSESVQAASSSEVFVAGHQIHWRTMHKHIAKNQQTPELFEPHISVEDFLYYRAEEVLYHLEPALHFWHEMEYVATHRDGRAISFNIMDMAQNFAQGLSFHQQKAHHLREALWDQLLLRYIALPNIEAHVLRQLDYQAFDPELLALANVEEF